MCYLEAGKLSINSTFKIILKIFSHKLYNLVSLSFINHFLNDRIIFVVGTLVLWLQFTNIMIFLCSFKIVPLCTYFTAIPIFFLL